MRSRAMRRRSAYEFGLEPEIKVEVEVEADVGAGSAAAREAEAGACEAEVEAPEGWTAVCTLDELDVSAPDECGP
jgi:hypothetical protein